MLAISARAQLAILLLLVSMIVVTDAAVSYRHNVSIHMYHIMCNSNSDLNSGPCGLVV